MVVVLTIKKMSYLVVGLFDDLVGPLIYICDIKFFGCAVCFNSTKGMNAFGFSLSHISYSNWRLLSYFYAKTFLLFQFFKLFNFDFFQNLVFDYN